MANWLRTLDLSDVWNKVRSKEITIQELSKIISERLAVLKPFADFASVEREREELIESFEAASEDTSLEADDFDCCMEELYNWGDISVDGVWNGSKVCWINIHL